MQFRINLCEQHYGFVSITADDADSALERVSEATEAGKVFWTKTELMSARIVDITLTCRHCGHDFVLSQIETDPDGDHALCPMCAQPTAFTIPNDSETLRNMLAYCRVKRIVRKGDCWRVEYRCDTSAPPEKPLETVSLCNLCRGAGCHIHTTAIDCEALLDGEKRPEDMGDYWKA